MSLMQLTVPFYRQKTLHTCGPACLKMLFAFHDKRVAERRIAIEAGTNRNTGTPRKAMLRAARSQGFACKMSSNGTWVDVQRCLQSGMPVLINYRDPFDDEGHYALVIGIHRKNAVLHDPYNGEEFELPIRTLKERWLGYKTSSADVGWMMTVEPLGNGGTVERKNT